jgi:putative proteasome-type protease
LVQHRYEKEDLESISVQWDQELKNALNNIPEDWMDAAFEEIETK